MSTKEIIKVTWYKSIKFNAFIQEIQKGGDYMKRSLKKGYIICLTN